jgi:hypothetical protein
LAVIVFILGSSWLTFDNDGEELQACITWRVPLADILLVGTRSPYQQRVTFVVFKAMFGVDVCRCSFSLLSIQCDIQAPASSGRSKEEDGRFVF